MDFVAYIRRHWHAQPLNGWLCHYSRSNFLDDLIAGSVVAILLIPQGMAYALLAGMPPEYGLYASMIPLLLYALLGSSRTLAVGPVAIASLMVNAALSEWAPLGSDLYIQAAVNLSLLVAVCLILMHAFKLGHVINFMSHGVISGFTSAAAFIIILSQFSHLLGLTVERGHFFTVLYQTLQALPQFDIATSSMGLCSLAILLLSKRPLAYVLAKLAVPHAWAATCCKIGPMFAMFAALLFNTYINNPSVSVVGQIPKGMPRLGIDLIDIHLWPALWMPAVLIALIGYVESISIGTALASKRRERIDPNRELFALGIANLGAALSHTFPVAGGFGRSMVNFSAGAQTTLASLITASLVAAVIAFFTPLFTDLPKTTLAAIIILAVIPLIDIDHLRQTWRYNKGDASILITTFLGVLLAGVEIGILLGIGLSIALLLKRTSQPHIAIIGRVGTSEHFRNIARHDVTTHPNILTLRIDESLFFANTRYVEQFILTQVAHHADIQHVLLNCAAVNAIDASALETLDTLSQQLAAENVMLHFAEVKGPVMDGLNRIGFIEKQHASQFFFTTDEGVKYLTKCCSC